MKSTLFPALLIIAILAAACSDHEELTAYDVARAQGMTPLIVELPSELRGTDRVVVELVGEDDVERDYTLGEGYSPGEILKIFIREREDGTYGLSVVGRDSSARISDFDAGDRRLLLAREEPIREAGEIVAIFGDPTEPSSWVPQGPSLGLRINVQEGR